MQAILSTRGIEIDMLRAQAKTGRTEIHAGIKFLPGALDGVDVVMTYSGPGKIAASVATQILFDKFDVDEVIFIGPASPLVPYLQQGDLVIGARSWQFDPAHVSEYGRENDADRNGAIIAADETLVRRITETYKELYSHRSNRPQLIEGTIVSDDHGIFNKRIIGLLQRELGVVALDREAATAAAVCAMNAKPFVVVRAIVDAQADIPSGAGRSGLQATPEHLTTLVREALVERQPVHVR